MAAAQPYSLSTGLAPADPQAEISAYLHSLRAQGFCVIDSVIPEGSLAEVRASVLASRPVIRAEHMRASAEWMDANGIAHDEGAQRLCPNAPAPAPAPAMPLPLPRRLPLPLGPSLPLPRRLQPAPAPGPGPSLPTRPTAAPGLLLLPLCPCSLGLKDWWD